MESRKEFLKLPIEKRRKILKEQANEAIKEGMYQQPVSDRPSYIPQQEINLAYVPPKPVSEDLNDNYYGKGFEDGEKFGRADCTEFVDYDY